ncbi:NIL domain protein [Planctomycetes bacterium Pla163]|jgi:L-aspartate semialdehyde sulfurtransferase ferredoxin|uniref:NIL domain protein n=1 Tax=Rohdeia mirabilis TaxID=2528008 RepID=A0A518D166_9BACT|nr:NIL domain protein [Planctomycetes bacterium Pla163]
MTVRKFFCTFPQELITEPIISHTLNAEFDVVPNIRAASITEHIALVAIDIEGDGDRIDLAVQFMRDRGVKVEELSDGEKPRMDLPK